MVIIPKFNCHQVFLTMFSRFRSIREITPQIFPICNRKFRPLTSRGFTSISSHVLLPTRNLSLSQKSIYQPRLHLPKPRFINSETKVSESKDEKPVSRFKQTSLRWLTRAGFVIFSGPGAIIWGSAVLWYLGMFLAPVYGYLITDREKRRNKKFVAERIRREKDKRENEIRNS